MFDEIVDIVKFLEKSAKFFLISRLAVTEKKKKNVPNDIRGMKTKISEPFSDEILINSLLFSRASPYR